MIRTLESKPHLTPKKTSSRDEFLPYKNHNRWLMLKRLWGKISHYSLLIVVGSFLCLSASAQFTTYSNEFMNIGAGARGMAMGDAQVASVSDGTAGYWNPAALANMNGGFRS
jgi:hypothetical protein